MEPAVENFQQIVECASDGIVLINGSGQIRYANKTAVELFGRPLLELRGEDLGLFYSRAQPTEIQIHNPTRGIISADVRSVELEFGGKTYAALYLRDLSERKRVEDRLRQSAAVFESTSEGVVITDPRGRIVDVNRAFTDITCYERSEVIGRTPRVLQSGRHSPRFYREMWLSLQQRGAWRGEIWNRRKTGDIYPEWLNIDSVYGENGQRTHYIGVFTDISSAKRNQAEIDRLAHRDALTGLANRVAFRSHVGLVVKQAAQNNYRVGASVLLLGLDGFKHINDSLGMAAGDQVLCEVARRLVSVVPGNDNIARLSGDEFAIVLDARQTNEGAATVAEHILQSLERPIQLESTEVFVEASIGIASYPRDGRSVDGLIQNSDSAMHRAKRSGGRTYRYYAKDWNAYAHDRVVLAAQLRRAISNDELVLYYQPQIDLRCNKVVGLEALVRWIHADEGLVSPVRFIPMAEETGLIEPLGEWVMEKACQQAADWWQQGIEFGRVAVNVSGVQIERSDMVAQVSRFLESSGLPSECLELEITESFLMTHIEAAADLLAGLKHLGVQLAMDDFGTGYSSLAYLKGLDFHTLKIDKSFLEGVPQQGSDAEILRTVVALGRSLGFKILAEGVETEQQRSFLMDSQCNYAQGYYFSPPVPAQAVPELIRKFAAVEA
ncbi:EAL domain-containing protein [Halorhodospira halochloris]|uniref:EAL domain-containing protein n=1 Tax=Halorhodospira halochloris TaxID=1052 RepID=UPI001EE83896|nr:EAL domain-containing protein [Halorhodospira halochloris]MCG5548372.1 EAL domain-containing protein [Halorhodospira halochloris]